MASAAKRAKELRGENKTWANIATVLNSENYKTPRGKRFSGASARNVVLSSHKRDKDNTQSNFQSRVQRKVKESFNRDKTYTTRRALFDSKDDLRAILSLNISDDYKMDLIVNTIYNRAKQITKAK